MFTFKSDKPLSLVVSSLLVVFITLTFYLNNSIITYVIGTLIFIAYLYFLSKSTIIVVEKNRIVCKRLILPNVNLWVIELNVVESIRINTVTPRFGNNKAVKLMKGNKQINKFNISGHSVKSIFDIINHTDFNGNIYLENTERKILLTNDNVVMY